MRELNQWLQARKTEGMPIAIMGDFGLQLDKSWATTFGLQANDLNITAPLRLKGQHAAMEFEIALPPSSGTTRPSCWWGRKLRRQSPWSNLWTRMAAATWAEP